MGKKGNKRVRLDIVPIESDSKLSHPPVSHKVLPQHEFAMLIVAPKGSGKTNLICNLLLNHYKGYFHRILVASPTVDNDEKWDVVKNTKHVLQENKKLKALMGDGIDPETKKKIPKIIFGSGEEVDTSVKKKFKGYVREEDFVNDMEELLPILKEQNDLIQHIRYELHQDQKAKYLADRILIIMDDQAGLFKGGNTRNPIVNFVLKHRHYNTSLVIVTQAYKAIPKTIRVNCNQLVCFEISNQSELQSIYEEHPCEMNEEHWMKMFKYATSKPYAFLYINDAFPKGHRTFVNFKEAIVTRADDNDQLNHKELQEESDTDSE